MDYKKLYKDALERAKKLQETCDNQTVVGWCEYIFPELKESEDEMVRKALIDYFDDIKKVGVWCNGLHPDVILAWLKKQGEPKPQRMISAEAKEALYDKPSWSEEDERICRDIINDIANDKRKCRIELLKEICDEQINWLESLKKRVKGE